MLILMKSNTIIFFSVFGCVVLVLFFSLFMFNKTRNKIEGHSFNNYYTDEIHKIHSEQDKQILLDLYNEMVKIDPQFSSIPIRVGDKAYTKNKRDIYLCLKNKDGKYYKKNTLAHVLLHELAHVVSTSYGEKGNEHNEEFYINFNILLEKAIKTKFYDPNIELEKNYCNQV
jgi:hypothetical protein